jgi:hypothetical protein
MERAVEVEVEGGGPVGAQTAPAAAAAAARAASAGLARVMRAHARSVGW